MNAWIPSPRTPPDDELAAERAAAAAWTVRARREHEGRLSALDAVARLEAGA